MSVLINFKICDNAKECGGVAVCPSGALSWDDEKKTIVIDNSKCTSCGSCEKSCEVQAIHVAKTEEEYQRLKKEIEDDPRKSSDLFIDRYGAATVHPAFLIKPGQFDLEILQSHKPVVLELFSDESIHCLLKSIPIKELLRDFDVKYRRDQIDEELQKKYNIQTLPALLFFHDGKLLNKIEGYCEIDQKKELVEKIDKIINKF